MTRFRISVLIAAGGSLALLLGAFAFQHLGGLAPCKLCIWQRWPHVAAIAIGAAALALGNRALAWLGALAAETSGPGASVAASLLFAMAALGALEHLFFALPLRDGALWGWAIAARDKRAHVNTMRGP